MKKRKIYAHGMINHMKMMRWAKRKIQRHRNDDNYFGLKLFTVVELPRRHKQFLRTYKHYLRRAKRDFKRAIELR